MRQRRQHLLLLLVAKQPARLGVELQRPVAIAKAVQDRGKLPFEVHRVDGSGWFLAGILEVKSALKRLNGIFEAPNVAVHGRDVGERTIHFRVITVLQVQGLLVKLQRCVEVTIASLLKCELFQLRWICAARRRDLGRFGGRGCRGDIGTCSFLLPRVSFSCRSCCRGRLRLRRGGICAWFGLGGSATPTKWPRASYAYNARKGLRASKPAARGG
mmetsp:Transcript_14744/g.32024  ORF Transcript_14744/g.32024 Transcript_14744/m.32024 type:complete len:215 (+) Transcript_14744:164-808(+)